MRRVIHFDVIAPFDGTVARILFEQGDKVEQGEAMFSLHVKGVTHEILSPVTGYAHSLEVAPGDTVISGMILGRVAEISE
ncbi:biotin/lipoyl-containing protein [Brevibacillus massiliensis]|jgi:pyruvate/2-oxoglutarate dehydrogenase complex dihydrolipoamide acyltransferase (E2) component|uniref:biotin/lipoyl-containing protein n=1 Tax=Brevibacillus massiliensis TaxID=1118054 RepID=UPI00054D2989|nr:biotin/lipoyl-containing protein [Brevibacillus massiliensis]